MHRWDIINAFIEKHNYKSYLEIGYYKGWSFDNVNCEKKVAVDPNPCKTVDQQMLGLGSSQRQPDGGTIVKTTSDEFFDLADRQNKISPTASWDIIFIDGLHEATQVSKDIKNALNHLSPGGTIVLHDCNPPTLAHATTGDPAGNWNGDVYKAFIKFRHEHRQHETYTIDTDWGCGVIRPSLGDFQLKMNVFFNHKYDHIPVEQALNNWEVFDENRKELLNLISVEEFKTKMNEEIKDHNVPA